MRFPCRFHYALIPIILPIVEQQQLFHEIATMSRSVFFYHMNAVKHADGRKCVLSFLVAFRTSGNATQKTWKTMTQRMAISWKKVINQVQEFPWKTIIIITK